MRLLRVELTRFFSRTLVRIGMLGVLGVVILALVGSWNYSRPMSDADLAFAKANFEMSVDDWAENGEEYIADCIEQQTLNQKTDPTADYGCDQMEPTWDSWVSTPNTFVEVADGVLPDIGFMVLFFAFLVGVSFVAAEFASGSMGNWLTFEPRRTRVLGSKVAAAAIGVLPASLVAAALAVSGTIAIYSIRGLLGEPTGEVWSELAWATVRLSLAAVGFAIIGVAIGTILRHTAAAIGVLVGYMVIVELIISNLFESVRSWLLMVNVNAVLQGGTTYGAFDCTMTSTGEMCEWVEYPVSLTHGVVLLLVVMVVLVIAAFAVFRRRDVN